MKKVKRSKYSVRGELQSTVIMLGRYLVRGYPADSRRTPVGVVSGLEVLNRLPPFAIGRNEAKRTRKAWMRDLKQKLPRVN